MVSSYFGGVLGTYIGVQDDQGSESYMENRTRSDLVETDSESAGHTAGRPGLGPAGPVWTGCGAGWRPGEGSRATVLAPVGTGLASGLDRAGPACNPVRPGVGPGAPAWRPVGPVLAPA